METVEYILQAIFIIIFFSLMLWGVIFSWMVFKSEKYLQVKEMDKQVRIAKADLKFEYKMAALNYKSNRNTRQNKSWRNPLLSKNNPHGIIDDNNYLNGVYTEFNPDIPYIIVVGERAIGKSQYSKVMSGWNCGVQYYSVQRYISLPLEIRRRAVRSIIIRDIEEMENID